MIPWKMALALALTVGVAVLLAGCGGGGKSEGTKQLGQDMATALRSLAQCEQIDFEGAGRRCPEALNTMVGACTLTIPLADFGLEDEEYGKVDPAMSRFCDEWEVILETPAFLADAKMIQLAQAIEGFVGD